MPKPKQLNNSIKNKLKQYFSFTRREQRGIAVLLILLALMVAATSLHPFGSPPVQQPPDSFAAEVDSFLAAVPSTPPSYDKPSNTVIAHSPINDSKLVNFDPNTLSPEEFGNLGLSKYVVKAIVNYRKAGGKFYKKEDLKKIYSLKPEDYSRLEPYITITQTQTIHKDTIYPPKFAKPSNLIVELNSADSANLTQLQGIGPSFASRIIKFRKKLGGFYQKQQLLEVYGFDAERLKKIENQLIIDSTKINKIDLNQVTFKNLLRHPYFEFHMVKAIVTYRQQHGGFKNVDDLLAIELMYSELYNKIRPYVSIGIYSPQTDARK